MLKKSRKTKKITGMGCRLHDAPASFSVCSSKETNRKRCRLLQQKRLMMDGGEADMQVRGSPGWSPGGRGASGQQTAATRPQLGSPAATATTTIVIAARLRFSSVAPGFLHLLPTLLDLGGFFWGSSNNSASVSPSESSGVGQLRSWYWDLNKHTHSHTPRGWW